MVEELLDHMDDRRRSAWRHSLPSPPGVDPLEQLRLDPDIDISCLPFHAGKVGRCRASLLDDPGQKIDLRNLSAGAVQFSSSYPFSTTSRSGGRGAAALPLALRSFFGLGWIRALILVAHD